ncbi:unnamed protein product [Sphenostylis stenocarpa]|uniref:Uncharacterized protein n=1 Tax=Sphenostylis stenocarpa TaxID=92480 RepID=A0AA86W4N8_9FABA|nr:unnamed protein product [Sphenostylis stenocarpa]
MCDWLPEGLSDPINCVSRSALARVLFLYERDSIKICHSLGDTLFSMNTPPLNDELCQSSPLTQPRENELDTLYKQRYELHTRRMNYIYGANRGGRSQLREPFHASHFLCSCVIASDMIDLITLRAKVRMCL